MKCIDDFRPRVVPGHGSAIIDPHPYPTAPVPMTHVGMADLCHSLLPAGIIAWTRSITAKFWASKAQKAARPNPVFFNFLDPVC
jgi:hypothetical protein